MTREECEREADRVRRVMSKRLGYVPDQITTKDARHHIVNNAKIEYPRPFVVDVFYWQVYLAVMDLGADELDVEEWRSASVVEASSLAKILEDPRPRRFIVTARLS